MKKPPIKKTDKNSTPAKKEPPSPEKKKLLDELKSLIEDINEDGLKFLIRQSGVLLHNMKVELVNAEIKKLTAEKNKDPETAAGRIKGKTSIEIVESDRGDSFVFVMNNTRKFFSLDEMKKIVKICRSANDQKDAADRLYSWFETNRGDALYDIGIKNATDPALGIIYDHIIKNYTTKK